MAGNFTGSLTVHAVFDGHILRTDSHFQQAAFRALLLQATWVHPPETIQPFTDSPEAILLVGSAEGRRRQIA